MLTRGFLHRARTTLAASRRLRMVCHGWVGSGRGSPLAPSGARSFQVLSAAQHDAFDRDGFVIMRGLLSSAEVEVVKTAIEQDQSLAGGSDNAIELSDAAGGKTDLHLWSKPGSGTLGLLTRSQRVVGTMQRLLAVGQEERASAAGTEVLHYHSKTLRKDPEKGGVWNWHQDYGYWYKDFFLAPHMATAWFAVDPSTRENGCLKVLKGSHTLGRLEHWAKGDQQGADEERVALALERFDEVYCEMEAGDVCFFHALALHSSEGNFSKQRRLAFASAFTRADNVQFKDAYIPCFPADAVPDAALLNQSLAAPGGALLGDAGDRVMLGADIGKAAARKGEDYADAIKQ